MADNEISLELIKTIKEHYQDVKKSGERNAEKISNSLDTTKANLNEAWEDIKNNKERLAVLESKHCEKKDLEKKVEENSRTLLKIYGNGSQYATGIIALMQKDVEELQKLKEIVHKNENQLTKYRDIGGFCAGLFTLAMGALAIFK